jgi:hypothetical protein
VLECGIYHEEPLLLADALASGTREMTAFGEMSAYFDDCTAVAALQKPWTITRISAAL